MSASIHLNNTDYGVTVRVAAIGFENTDSGKSWGTIDLIPLNRDGAQNHDAKFQLFLSEDTFRDIAKQLEVVIAEFDQAKEPRYAKCAGCGRMFNIKTELDDLNTHDCEEDSE